MTKAEVTVLHAAAEMDIVAEKENETRYLLNGGNASSVKVGSDVYVNVNGKDSDNGVVVEWGGNCIVEEDHEVKSESDSVTITMNQQAVEKPVEEKGGYVKEKLGDGDDCLANGIAKQSASEAAAVIDSSVEQSDDKVHDLVNGVSTDDDTTHKVSVNSISSNPIVSVGGISFVVDVQSNQYSGNLADLEMASKLVGKSMDVVSGLKSETNVSSDSISVVESNPAEKTCGFTNGGIQFGSFDDKAERETPFNYMIRVPRNDDERLKVMIRLARNKLMVQVEKFMDLWNNNYAFRKEYVRCNEGSTLWRLRTLDGRSLGPGEVPPVIPLAVNGRAVMDHTMSGVTLEGRTQEEVAVEKAEKVLAAKVVAQKKFIKSAPPESVSATASNGDKIEEAEKEKLGRTREEEESDRKAEELRKEEEADKIKEQCQLEEIAKAKEALERKRRKAEKAHRKKT